MSTIANCVYDLTRLTDKYCDTVGIIGISDYLDEWRIQENALTNRGPLQLSREEHARRMMSYRLGGSDLVMAVRVGCRRQSFFEWRKRQGLPPKGVPGGQREVRRLDDKCDFIAEESM